MNKFFLKKKNEPSTNESMALLGVNRTSQSDNNKSGAPPKFSPNSSQPQTVHLQAFNQQDADNFSRKFKFN